MTITEALQTLRDARSLTGQFEVQLACSFSPLHLKTLLAAHLQKLLPDRQAAVREGIFGDLIGTIQQSSGAEAIAIALEWQDLDPRLKYREGGAWGSALAIDLLSTVKLMLARLEEALDGVALHARIALSLPTLPLPPVFHTSTWQAGTSEMLLHRELIDFAGRIAQRKQLSVVNADWLAQNSPYSCRFDLKSELLVGFPYSVSHADVLASSLARLLTPKQPLKGVITDLDNTLWNGLVGEVGTDAVRWDPATRYYLHGLYQKLLAALSDQGILVGIASKNDSQVVAEVLKRSDLLIAPSKLFPVEVHWAAKSESVSRILKTWNISADSVAFIDDTPLELAEVAAAHPGITYLQFPAGDYNGVWQMLHRLRDLCGKSQLSEDDALRLESIRQGAQFHEQANESGSGDEFLSTVKATVAFDFDASPLNPRTLELVNKTNQFNLNGVRFTEAEWQKRIERPDAFVATVKYEDKFGALGTIAVVQGHQVGGELKVQTWVMSCRAFSRRIEHATLRKFFERFQANSIAFEFAPTAKNGPSQEFFSKILGRVPKEAFMCTRDEFESVCPALYQRVEETSGVMLNG